MATKKQIRDAAAANKKWLIAKQKKHVKMIEKSLRLLQANILDSLLALETTKAGKLSALSVNSQALQKIHKSIITKFNFTFNDSTRLIIEDFKTAKNQIRRNFTMVDEVARFTDIDNVMMKALRDGNYQRYLSLSRDAQSRVVQSMYNQVIAGGQFSDLVNTINNVLVGSAAKGVTGYSLAQYSRLYARDMIMNYHNDVMMQKAADLGMTDMVYIGTIMSRTRRFCAQRVGNTYSKDTINGWKGKWKGKSGPALTYRGGYNCRHHWQPVRKEWLEEKELENYNKLNKLDDKMNIIGTYTPKK